MKNWLYAHVENPYPSQGEKDLMSVRMCCCVVANSAPFRVSHAFLRLCVACTWQEETGLTIKQINNWFINARRRYLVSKVDEPAQVSGKRLRDGRPDEYDVYEDEEDDFDGDVYEQGPW